MHAIGSPREINLSVIYRRSVKVKVAYPRGSMINRATGWTRMVKKGNYFLHKIRSHHVATDVGELVLTMYRLVSGGGQHQDLVPLVGEQRRVNFDR